MKKKSLSLFIALLALIGVAVVFLRTKPQSSSASAANGPTPRSGSAADQTGPPDAQTARRLSPVGWNPPAVFSAAGPPTPQPFFARGDNASREYHAPETRELPRRLGTRVPSVLAKTPEDGRLHLLPEEIDLHTRLARRMVFDPAALDTIIGGNTSRILAPTTGDEVLTLEFHTVKTRSAQSHSLLGRVVGEETSSDVLVVYHDGVIHGTVARYAAAIDQHLEYRILADGHMMVRELDPTTMTAGCGNGPETETAAEGLIDGNSEDGIEIIPQNEGEVSEDTPGWRTIDVVVGYDAGARVADGGYSQIEARIIASVDRMTTAFANSLITNTELMLLGTIEDPAYVYPGAVAGSMSTSDELGNLNNFTNGTLDAVSSYCTLLGADMVSFIIKQADGSAGIAYRPGRSSVTARDYMTSTRITFVHELGHNLGCDHSWGDSSQSNHSHYGWRIEPPGLTRVRTIMAYDWGWGNGHRIPYFANPNVSYNGAATGTVNGYNVQGDTTADQRYYQGGLGYSGSDPLKFGFNGANSTLGANNSNTINTGGGGSSYGATFASNRASRTSFAVTSPVAGVELTRGATQSIFFRGGDMDDLATIQAFKGGVLQSTLATNLNPATKRNFIWNIPTDFPSGLDYRIRVTLNHAGGGTSTAESGIFTILGSAPLILAHTPAASPSVGGPVSQVSLTFNQAMNPASFSIGTDIVSFTGPLGLTVGATGATWSGGNTVLNIQFPAQSQSGFYRMVVGPEITSSDGYLIDQNLNDIPGESVADRYVASFQITGVAPAAWVTSHSPQGVVEDFHSSVWLEFSQSMNTGSFALGDIASFTGPSGSITATGFQWLHPTLLRIDFPAQYALGQYTLTLAPTVLDAAGRQLDQDFDGTAGEINDDSYAAIFQIGSTAGPVDHFAITGVPASITYGATINGITLTARDAADKIAATFSGTVNFSGTAGVTGTSASFVDGVLTNVSITPPVIGSGLTFIVDDGAGHTGTATLTVSPIPATIEFVSGSLNQTYNGSPRIVTATTTPPGLAYSVSYESEPAAPTNAGGYDVSATITAPNYQGGVSDILIVAKAAQTIDFAPLATMGNDQEPFALTGTATSGLPVSYASSNPAVATVSGDTVTIVADGTTTITASQAGNINYLPATSVQRSFTVLRVQPVANSGGPYKVLIGQTLALNGSASLPSDGATLTAYEWDLNNDTTFGDATGATPSAISYADLTGPWGMIPGMNTIKLIVTDSAGKTATVATTVELVISLTWDANNTGSGQTNGAGAWLGNNLWWEGSANLNWIPGSNAVFGGPNTAGGAVTLSSPTTVNAITFNTFSGTYTLGSAAQTLTTNSGITLNSGAKNLTVSSPVVLGGTQSWLNNSSDNAIQLIASGTVDNGGFDLTIGGSVPTPPNRTTANVRINGIISGEGGLTKSGAGVLWLGGAVNNTYTGPTIVSGGILRVQGTTNLSGLPSGNITLNGGVLESYWNDTFTRTLGGGTDQIQITGGAAGFSQHGNATLNILLNNDATTPIQWGGTFFAPSKLILQEYTGDTSSQTVFQNRLNLNGANRTVEVNGLGAARATISGVISNAAGTAGLIKTGNGMLILSANNTYNGTTTVSAGFVDFGAITLSGFGGGSGRNISVAAGAIVRRNTLDNAFLNRLVETSDEITVMTATTGNNLNFGSSTGANLPNAFLGNWASNGAKMEYTGTLTPASDAYRLGGKSSNGLLAIVGTNKLTGARGLIVGATGATAIRAMLAGANDFSGDTVINTGAKLTIANNLALQNSALNVGPSGGTFALNSAGTVTSAASSPSPTFGGLKGSRSLLSVFTNAGGNNESNLAATAVTGFTLNPGSGVSCTYSGAIADFATGTTLTKTGLGTQILAGANTYTGATTVSAGKLLVNGSLGNTAVGLTVNPGATLGGTGTIGRNVTIASGGRLEFDISTAAASHDRLDVSSGRSFTFSGASELTITSSSGATPGTYTLIAGGDNITGVAPATVNLPSNWVATVSISANSLLLNLTSTVGDNTPPTLVSIADDKSGGPVPINTPVTYTVTFSEDMNSTTATDADFGNAGTSAVTIGTITETTPGVFTVQATPTTAGTLQFRINAGAVITDIAGNELVTTNAFADDTSITVGSVFDAWANGSFSNGTLTNKDVTFDFDGGGLATGVEWVVGGDPTTGTDDAAKSPTCDATTDPSYLIFSYRRSDAANTDTNTEINVQYCSDLGEWNNAMAGPDIVINEYDNFHGSNPGIDKVEVKIRRTPELGNKLFTRLNVMVAP